MIVFSASRAAGSGKIFYKGYKETVVEGMEDLGKIARTHSISSYLYGPGVTTGGEVCDGHKAGESVIGAGNVMLFDFDAKGDRVISMEDIVDRLTAAGAVAWVGGSKSWSIDRPKLHVAVLVGEELPLNKDEYELWHKAAAQYLKLDPYEDPAMEGWTQQLAPSGDREDIPSVVVGEGGAGTAVGRPLDMATVFAVYRWPAAGGAGAADAAGVGAAGGEPGGVGESKVEGTVAADAVFVLSRDGRTEVGVKEMLAMVAGGKKVRVHCLMGIEHDGRRDTALVRGGENGGAFYHCTGGRCGHTLALVDPEPFDEIESDELPGSVEVGVGSVGDELEDVQYLIADSPVHGGVYAGDGRIKDRAKDAAVGYGGEMLFAAWDVRLIDDLLMRFDGSVWRPMFPTDNDFFRWVQQLYIAARFPEMASVVTSVRSTMQLLLSSARVGVLAGSDGSGSDAGRRRGRDVLNMQNGMLDIQTGVLMPADREELFTTVLPFAWEGGAKCEMWEAVVDKLMLGSETMVMALQDAMGYMFARRLHLELMVGMVGDGANGKSTVIEVMHRLVGPGGTSSLSLHMLTKPSAEGAYAKAGLAGKWVNFTSELSAGALMSNEFKELISGVRISARHPYGRPFEIAVAPKQFCAMNSTAGLIKEQTRGFMRRLHLIPFSYSISEEEKDVELMSKLALELPGILNWVLVGTRRVIAARALTKAPQMEILLAEVRRDSNPIQQFLEERTGRHPEAADAVSPHHRLVGMVVGVSELFEKYREFCLDNEYRPLGRNEFSKGVERLGVQKINTAVKVRGVVEKACGFYLKTKARGDWDEPKSGYTFTAAEGE